MNSNVSGSGAEEAEVKKSIAIFAYKQRLLSIEMKTKLVNIFKVFRFSSFQTFQVPSTCLTFRIFLKIFS